MMLLQCQNFLILLLITYYSVISVDLNSNNQINRPSIVLKAMESNDVMYYVGVGSNMLRSKVVNRFRNSTIDIISMEPAIVVNHRLAFNMRALPPLEPSMGGIEPEENQTCHCALIKLKANEYQKIWLSEGGGNGYDEVIVNATPYNSLHTVKAVALRASKLSRLSKDVSPSQRYLNIIIGGATELGLDQSYIQNLKSIKTSKPSYILSLIFQYHLQFFALLLKLKIRINYAQLLSKIIYFLYVPYYKSYILGVLSEFIIGLLLLPGALIGCLINLYTKIFKKTPITLFSK